MKLKKVKVEVMIRYIIAHSKNEQELQYFQRIQSGEADIKWEYTYRGAYTRGVLDGDFKTAIRYASHDNIKAFIALVSEGNYDISIHKLLNDRMFMLKIPGGKLTFDYLPFKNL
ncbi:MAG: hypothetical protein ACJ75J_11025 [Cytophagaceae bacterium]